MHWLSIPTYIPNVSKRFGNRKIAFKSQTTTIALALTLQFLILSLFSTNSNAEITLSNQSTVMPLDNGRLFIAEDDRFPALDQLEQWLNDRQPVSNVNLTGGAYWLYAEVKNDTVDATWVLNPNGTIIENVKIGNYSSDGRLSTVPTGYYSHHDYMLHYGKDIQLDKNTENKILIYFDSTYFASQPSFSLVKPASYQSQILWQNTLILAAFGALITLALYNIFIFSLTKDSEFLYYSIYLATYFLGWAFTFHLFADLFDLYALNLHYVPFFLLPVFSTLFYTRFLKLKKHNKTLYKVSRINYILPLLLLPSCFLALSYAHLLASVVITIWLTLALVSGISCLKAGYQPARYFVLAFLAIIIPGAIILPANLGLIPDLVSNSELLTLLGGTLDAILLAFALADKIRLLDKEKNLAIEQSRQLLEIAHTDRLTGIGNRLAFDIAFQQVFTQVRSNDNLLIIIDLDGLKTVNDKYGHSQGDELLKMFSQKLAKTQSQEISIYRLGGDEFTILAKTSKIALLETTIEEIEKTLWANGFKEAGISYGVAYVSECNNRHELFKLADKRMYEYKSKNRKTKTTQKTETDLVF